VSVAGRKALVARTTDDGALGSTSRAHRRSVDNQLSALGTIFNYSGFACRALWRRKGLTVATFLLTFSLTIVATVLTPPTYEIEVKLLTQRNGLMASIGNPGRTVPWDADAPTRAAAEMVLRRDNIMSLIRQNDLLTEWERSRPPVLRFGDRMKAMIRRRQPTLDERLEQLISEIEKRMSVSTVSPVDGVVTIHLTWPDPRSGYLLVEGAQKSFADARQLAETHAIAETIAILDQHASSLSSELRLTLSELARTRARVEAALPAAARTATTRPASAVTSALGPIDPLEEVPSFSDDPVVDAGALLNPRLARLKATINSKRFELSRLEDEQKRRLAELEAQLAVARAIYTPGHPTVQSLQQNVANSQYNSPQIALLRAEVDRLETEADELAAADAERLIRAAIASQGNAPAPRARRPVPVVPAVAAPPPPDQTTLGEPRRDAVAEFATLRLRTELSQLQSILERTDSARIELAVSQAAFKYRYTIIEPAEEPSEKSFPDTGPVVIAGFLASILFAIVAGIAADIMSNRILEPWQVQHQLEMPLLGHVRLS
jgi:uncharacterized protein involved in exopolysaccharide biosynthesis